jgi:hypothetical protein
MLPIDLNYSKARFAKGFHEVRIGIICVEGGDYCTSEPGKVEEKTHLR